MTTNKTIDELDNKIDDLLLQFTKGYGALTVTFSGKIGDDTKVFQIPYNMLRKAIKLLVSDESQAITQAMLDALPEKSSLDKHRKPNRQIGTLYLSQHDEGFNEAIELVEAAIKKIGGK